MAGHSNSSALAPFVSQEIGAPFFVWGVWGLTLAVATSFTINFGTNLPIWDDWAYVFPLKYSLSISWLWALHNEHRLPLPKLLNFALLKVTGIDFRAGMFFNVFGLSFLAFFLIRKARNLRGWIAYTDAFLPLALVSLSQYPIFLWSFQVQFGLFAILLGIFLGIIVSEPNHLDFHAFPAGICLILLPLCGMMGVGVVPALGGWLGYRAFLYLRSEAKNDKLKGLVIIIVVAAAYLLTGLIFVGWTTDLFSDYSNTIPSAIINGLQFLTVGFGESGEYYWPLSGLLLFVLIIASLFVLGWVGWSQIGNRTRALGLLFYLGAMSSLALGMGWGRAGSLFDARYVTLAIPTMCAIYFIWILAPTPFGKLIQIALFSTFCLFFLVECRQALAAARAIKKNANSFCNDLTNGIPPSLLAKKYGRFLLPWEEVESVVHHMRDLKTSGFGPFQEMIDDHSAQEVPLSLVPTSTHEIHWNNGFAFGWGPQSSITFSMKKPQFAYAVSLGITYSDISLAAPSCHFQLFWKKPAQTDFPNTDQSANLVLEHIRKPDYFSRYFFKPGRQTVTIWVADTIDQLRMHPSDKAFIAKIEEIVVMVPNRETDKESN